MQIFYFLLQTKKHNLYRGFLKQQFIIAIISIAIRASVWTKNMFDVLYMLGVLV